jgi:hypothetical protein
MTRTPSARLPGLGSDLGTEERGDAVDAPDAAVVESGSERVPRHLRRSTARQHRCRTSERIGLAGEAERVTDFDHQCCLRDRTMPGSSRNVVACSSSRRLDTESAEADQSGVDLAVRAEPVAELGTELGELAAM